MVKQELIDRSSVRFLDKALNGGIKAGEIGVLTSKKGVGKTSVLVQIGFDKLIQGKQVVHVSFDQHASYVMTWYEDIYTEMSKKRKIDADFKDDIFKNRVVLNFNQDTVSTKQIISTMKALSQGGIKPECVIIDGLNFAKRTNEDFAEMKAFAKEAGIAVWYSYNTDASALTDMFDKALLDLFDAVVYFEAKPDSTQLRILKVRNEAIKEANLKLDPKTLLIAEK
ncbi:MAG: AAA family ATPase [Spirochaetaceae bacterium]|nr:AAA family ATPase [Spirochaetaceae bacterium]MBO7485706.1 AAA family ATPase [Spirochaetaceae bacterium]